VLAACVALVLGDKEPHEDSKESAVSLLSSQIPYNNYS